SPWRTFHADFLVRVLGEASIRPRRCRRGEQTDASRRSRPTPPLQFGHGVVAVENREQLEWHRQNEVGFNSATALSPWRTDASGIPLADLMTLQFGHGVVAVENRSLVQCPFPHAFGFNSATALSPWRTSVL